jgi:hypothetical protein
LLGWIAEGVETPWQLGEGYQRELCGLVDQGEISPSFARRVMDDLFIAGESVQPPRLRPSVWSFYVAELTGDFSWVGAGRWIGKAEPKKLLARPSTSRSA